MKASNKWIVALVVFIGPSLALLDSTIVTVVLSQLQNAFQTDFATITWTITTYSLAQAAVIPIVGYMSDRTSAKVVFLTSLALFTIGSLLCALAPTKEALFAFRALQGLGGGALMPLSLAIVFRIFPPHERGKVIAIAGLPVVLAPAFGPTLGGLLSTTFGWPAVFLLNVPIGVAGLLLAFRVVPGYQSDQSGHTQKTRQGFDLPGLLLSMAGFTSLVYGISLAGLQGWSDPTVITSILIGLAILVVFVVIELRVSDPVLDLRLFLNYTFSIANLLIWVIVGVFYGSLFLLPLFFESVLHTDALTTGNFLIVQGLAVGIAYTTGGYLYNRIEPRILAVLGLFLLVAGTYKLTQLDVNTTGGALQIWLLLRGFGLGLMNQPLQTLALSVVSNKGMAKASSLVNATRQVATAVAVAALTTYLTEQTVQHGTGPQAIAAGMNDTFWIVLILSAICIPLALFIGNDPAIEAHKQAKQAKASGEEVKITSSPNVISALTTNGADVMGSEILVWRYPENNINHGSSLSVEGNHFCVLKILGGVATVYEAGQHIIHTPACNGLDVTQLSFSGEPIRWQSEVFYINRAKLLIKINGVALSREMTEVDYRVDYSIHIATREDAARLLQHMPHEGHTLVLRDIHAYTVPIIKQVMHQILHVTPLEQVHTKMQVLSQLLHQRFQSDLSTYGITLDEVSVLELEPRNERGKLYVSIINTA